MKKKLIAGFIVLLVVFLLGFVPENLEKRQLRGELTTSKEELEKAGLRDLAGMMLLAVLRQNFGDARDYATKYFDALRIASDKTEIAEFKSSLQELLSKRDSTIAALGKNDPASASEIQKIFARTIEITKVQR